MSLPVAVSGFRPIKHSIEIWENADERHVLCIGMEKQTRSVFEQWQKWTDRKYIYIEQLSDSSTIACVCISDKLWYEINTNWRKIASLCQLKKKQVPICLWTELQQLYDNDIPCI